VLVGDEVAVDDVGEAPFQCPDGFLFRFAFFEFAFVEAASARAPAWMSSHSSNISRDSADLRNLPPGLVGTHLPVTLISRPIRDGSARNGANGSTGCVNSNLHQTINRNYQPTHPPI
jgi:hypothetical protein